MNKEELKNYRKNFFINLDKKINQKRKLSVDDYYTTISQTARENRPSKKTNKNIFVYIGSYMKTENIFDGAEEEILTYDNNPKTAFKLYKNIESDLIYKIKAKKTQKFEEENKVIFPPVELYNLDEYNRHYEKIKLQYYRNLLYNKQKDSYKLIKKIDKIQKKERK